MSRLLRGARPALPWFLFALVLAAALPALAADPVAKGDVSAGAAPTAVPAPVGEKAVGPAPAAPGVPAQIRPLTPEEQALRQILDESQARVAALLAEGQADLSRMDQIQQEVVKVKSESRIRFLQTKIDFARDRGDQRGLDEAQSALELALHPQVPAAQSTPTDRELNDPKAREVQR